MMMMMNSQPSLFSPTCRFSLQPQNQRRSLLRCSTSRSSAPDFLPSYLVTECGFSPEKAITAAQLIRRRFCTPDQLDSVISFFKSHGFNDSHLKRLISNYPQVLTLSVEKTLVPRFDAFHELGFTGDDLVTLVCSNPYALNRSMESQVVPMLKLWIRLLGSHSLLMKCLTRSHWQIITMGLQTTTENISILQECGLSDHQVSLLVSKQPAIMTHKSEWLNKLVSRVERLGLPRGSPNFRRGLYVLSMVSEANLRPKVELLKRFGWTEDDFAKAFCKSPGFITYSSKVLKAKMEFLLKEAGCPASYIAMNPGILSYSLEKRIIPRVKVLKALKEKGLSGGDHKLSGSICFTNENFIVKYIAPYKEEFPELSELFSVCC